MSQPGPAMKKSVKNVDAGFAVVYTSGMETMKRRPGRPRKDQEPVVSVNIGESFHAKLSEFSRENRRTIREVAETAIEKYVASPVVDR